MSPESCVLFSAFGLVLAVNEKLCLPADNPGDMDRDPHRPQWLRQYGVPRERPAALQAEGRHGDRSSPAQEHSGGAQRPGPGAGWEQ